MAGVGSGREGHETSARSLAAMAVVVRSRRRDFSTTGPTLDTASLLI